MSDWDYYSDDYWDQDSPKKRKRKDVIGQTANGSNVADEVGMKKKRRDLNSSETIPKLSLDNANVAASIVIWRSKSELLQLVEEPIFNEGQGEKVALLKNWRKRFKMPTKDDPTEPPSTDLQRPRNQKAVAVVIKTKPSGEDCTRKSPPLSLAESKDLPSRMKISKPLNTGIPLVANDTTTTENEVQGGLISNSELDLPIHEAAPNGHKRKAHTQLDSENPNVEPGAPKKRGRHSKKKADEQDLHEEQSVVKNITSVRAGVRIAHNGLPKMNNVNGVGEKRSKRKVDSSEDELAMPTRKQRNASKRGRIAHGPDVAGKESSTHGMRGKRGRRSDD